VISTMQTELKQALHARRDGHSPEQAPVDGVSCSTGLSRWPGTLWCLDRCPDLFPRALRRGPTTRFMAWAAFVVLTTGAGLAFDAGVSGEFGHTVASYEHLATPHPDTFTQPDGSQFQGPSRQRVCWPIEAGVDAQCFDSP